MVDDLSTASNCSCCGTDQEHPSRMRPFVDIRLRGRFENGAFIPESSGVRDEDTS